MCYHEQASQRSRFILICHLDLQAVPKAGDGAVPNILVAELSGLSTGHLTGTVAPLVHHAECFSHPNPSIGSLSRCLGDMS